MEALTCRLRVIFEQLEQSNLVMERNVDPENISSFTETLNLVRSVTEYEKGTSDFVRFLYKQNRGAFHRYVNSTNMQYLILYTDGYPITEKLGIDDIVLIHWD